MAKGKALDEEYQSESSLIDRAESAFGKPSCRFMRHGKALLLALPFVSIQVWAAANPSEISVKLVPDRREYIVGERISAVVDVANSSADSIDVGKPGSADIFRLEVFRASDMASRDRIGSKPIVKPFLLHSSEGQKLAMFIGDHFALNDPMRYLARAVLVHDGARFESSLVSFDIVPGMRVGGAMQMFSNKPGLKRVFELVYWTRGQREHLFLKAKDEGGRVWRTTDLGVLLRITEPKISVMPNGEVVVLHRATQDQFMRSVFWSLPDALDFRKQEPMVDPDIAGSQRMRDLYMESGGVTPVKKAWWKFW